MIGTSDEAKSTCNVTENNISEEMYINFSYWTEYVIQSIIGVIGIASNTIAIPVLCSREMNTTFNRILTFLAIFDNFFIICQISEARRKMTNAKYNDEKIFSQAHEYAFGYFMYGFHSFVLSSSMFTTVALAVERYQAVQSPVKYHQKTRGTNPWKRAITHYLIPVIIFSSLFCMPKIFEIELVQYSQPIYLNNSIIKTINLTIAQPTDLRMNEIYVVSWANIATLTIQGIIPIISLCFFNYRIYRVMTNRSTLMKRSTFQTLIIPEREGLSKTEANQNEITEKFDAQKKLRESKQSKVLFIIVICYLLFHSPRFLIRLHEFYSLDIFKESIKGAKDGQRNCDSFPFWVLSCTCVSHLLLTMNSSCNFFIYCFLSPKFQTVLRRRAQITIKCCSDFTFSEIKDASPKRENDNTAANDAVNIELDSMNIISIQPRMIEEDKTTCKLNKAKNFLCDKHTNEICQL